MTKKYDELKNKILKSQKEHVFFMSQYIKDKKEINELKQKRKQAIENNDDIENISKEISHLQNKILDKQSVVDSYNEDNLFNYRDAIKKLADEVIAENTDIFFRQVEMYDNLVEELAEIKSVLLEKIQEAGKIKRENEVIISEVKIANSYTDMKKDIKAIDIDKRIGKYYKDIIFTTKKECRLAFQNKIKIPKFSKMKIYENH